ncbi:MAG: hypothetical protein CVV44_06170 [Spirochaetae bacterium HGW-Spirochaetae-1]|jgi:hypothetical protein|nr:MAG: hypothetical protein CVV44_06170 [Spirochaetae bacterium HGW-Spirochaetae-1]
MTKAWKYSLFAIIGIIFCTVSLLSGEKTGDDEFLKINAAVKPEKGTVGDILEYRVTIAGKEMKGVDILLPEKKEFYPDENPAAGKGKKKTGEEQDEDDPARHVPLYVIHSAKKEDSSDKEMTYIAVVMRLSYYRPGTFALPEIEISGKDKIKVGYKIPSVEISALNSEAQLQEIEPPLALGGNYYRLIILIAAAVIVTLLALWGYRYLKKRREAAQAIVPEVDPLEAFLKEMDDLGGRALIVNGKVEEYIVGVSMIFRRYLSRLFHFDATEMTSAEIDDTLKKISRRFNTKAYHDEIMLRFGLWDLSKFAEFTPSEDVLLESHEKTMGLARNLREVAGHVAT